MTEAVLNDLVFNVVGAAMTVHREIGYGQTYERSLAVELEHLKIPFSQQSRYPVIYRNVKVDEYIPDLEVQEALIVDTKTIESIGDYKIGQMLSYLRITGKNAGLILNFKHPSLKWRKITLAPSSSQPRAN